MTYFLRIESYSYPKEIVEMDLCAPIEEDNCIPQRPTLKSETTFILTDKYILVGQLDGNNIYRKKYDPNILKYIYYQELPNGKINYKMNLFDHIEIGKIFEIKASIDTKGSYKSKEEVLKEMDRAVLSIRKIEE